MDHGSTTKTNTILKVNIFKSTYYQTSYMKNTSLLISFFVLSVVKGNCQSWGDSTVKHHPLFYSVEKAPKFPGGLHAFYQFIADSLQMPDKEFAVFSNKLVIARIVIGTTGKIVFADIEKAVNENYNNAALEMIKKMPDWSPGIQNGHAVPTSVSIPILFVN